MRPKASAITTEASAAATTTDAPTLQLDQRAGEASPAALVTFAEEFARLLARRLLADLDRRRGYSLPEFLLGALILALVMLLAVRGLGLVPR